MMNDKNDTGHHQRVLLEDINHKFDVILEYLTPLASLPGDVAQLKDDMVEVKGNITVMKAVLKDNSKDISELKGGMVEVKTDAKTIKLAIGHQKEEHDSLVKQMAKHWNKKL